MPTPQNALMQPRIDGEMRATQPRNALLGLLADALYAADKYAQRPNPSMPMGKANPPLSLLSSALGLGDIAATADRYNMRQDLTRGSGWATQMLPETANALLSVGPAVAKYPKQAAAVTAGLLSGDTNAAKAALVWHGSPHKFDKFDSSKIGTGEGAQAYGHGLYLAENPAVATEYRRTLSAGVPEVIINGRRVAGTPFNSAANQLALSRDTITRDDLAGHLQQRIQELSASTDPLARAGLAEAKKAKAALDKAKDVAINYDGSAGSLYKVDLPDSAISRMLDWDKPLSQQAPEVQKAVIAIAPKNRSGQSMIGLDATGAEVARALGLGDGASNLFRQQGIPGIRYLDGGSRGAGAGTSNFVVFPGEEGLLSILERNGVPVK